jgi:hypothetical protein
MKPRRDAWPYFCSFQTFTCFEMGPPRRREEGSDYYWSLPVYWGVTVLGLTLTHSLKSKSKLCYDRRSVGQSVFVSSTHLRPKTIFYYCQTVTGLFMWGSLSDERTGLPFTIAAGTRQRTHSQVRVPRDSWPYFTISDSRPPKLEDQVPVFISPKNMLAQLYPQALGSLFIVSDDSRGTYSNRIHPGANWNLDLSSL